MVGVDVGSANTPVPHPDNKIDIPKNKANIFFIRFLLIEFPDDLYLLSVSHGAM